MPSMDSLFGIHATALKLREQRMSMLASNIANAATPGYKARDIEFSSALQLAEDGQVTRSRHSLPRSRASPRSMATPSSLPPSRPPLPKTRSPTVRAFPSFKGASARITRALKGE